MARTNGAVTKHQRINSTEPTSPNSKSGRRRMNRLQKSKIITSLSDDLLEEIFCSSDGNFLDFPESLAVKGGSQDSTLSPPCIISYIPKQDCLRSIKFKLGWCRTRKDEAGSTCSSPMSDARSSCFMSDTESFCTSPGGDDVFDDCPLTAREDDGRSPGPVHSLPFKLSIKVQERLQKGPTEAAHDVAITFPETPSQATPAPHDLKDYTTETTETGKLFDIDMHVQEKPKIVSDLQIDSLQVQVQSYSTIDFSQLNLSPALSPSITQDRFTFSPESDEFHKVPCSFQPEQMRIPGSLNFWTSNRRHLSLNLYQ